MRRFAIVLSILLGAAMPAFADLQPIISSQPKLPTAPTLPTLNLQLPQLAVPVIERVDALGSGVDFEITMKTFGVQLCYLHEADRPTIGPEGFRCDDDFVRVFIDDVAVARRSLFIDASHNSIEVLNQQLTAGFHSFKVQINCKPIFDLVRTSAAVKINYFPPVPTPVISSVNVTSDGYEIVGTNFGSTATGVLIAATAAVPNADFVSYTPQAADLLSYSSTRISIRTDAVMGSVTHQIFVPDPHYPNRKSNQVTQSHPLRISLGSVTPDLNGYTIVTNHYGTDLANATVLEGSTQVAASKIARLSSTSLHVNNRLSGSVTHSLRSALPGVSPSRSLTVTHPDRPTISSIRMTEYGFDVRGSHFGTDPSKVSVTFAAFSGTVGGSVSANQAFVHSLSDSVIGVNYLGACTRLYANPTQQTTDMDVLLITGAQTGFFGPTFRSTIPALGAEYKPTVTAVNATTEGLEILGTHLGDPAEVCQLQLLILNATGGSLQVDGAATAARFLSVSSTRWLVDVSGLTAVTGERDVIVSRVGFASPRFHLAAGS